MNITEESKQFSQLQYFNNSHTKYYAMHNPCQFWF